MLLLHWCCNLPEHPRSVCCLLLRWFLPILTVHPMLQAAADHLEQLIGHYNPKNVCNILWTYATLGYYPGGSPLDVAADYALHALEVSKALKSCSCCSQDACNSAIVSCTL